MTYFEECDQFTGERSSFGGIAEASAEYHARGETCPWDCWRCDPEAVEARGELLAEIATREVQVTLDPPTDVVDLDEPPF